MNPLATAVAHPRSAAVFGALAIAFSGIFYVLVGRVAVDRRVLALRVRTADPRARRLGERRTLGPMSRRAVGLCTVGGVCFAVDLITFHYAVDVIGAGLATVMGNVQVVIVALVAWAVFGERPKREVLVAMPVMLPGVVLISGGGRHRRVRRRTRPRRDDRARDGDRVRRIPPDHPAGDAGPAIGRARGDRDGGHRGVRARCSATLVGDLDLGPALPAHGYLIALGVLSQSSATSPSRRPCRGCRR